MKHFFHSKIPATALLAVVFVATWIAPPWPRDQAMNDSLALLAFYALWKYQQKNPVSNRDYFLLVIFLCAHSIGARWLYSNVPYEQWLQAMFGFTLKQSLGWSRNHFDRLVHFLYGFCLTPAIVAHVVRRYQQSRLSGFYFAITAIMVTSLCYEWFEWLVALTLSAKDAESYNGQQGDMWDAHKDMLMATIGSALWFRHYCKRQDQLPVSPN